MEINLENFELYLTWTVRILKTQDPQVICSFKQEAKRCLSAEELSNVLIAALHCLAETDPEAFTWALHHYDPEFYVEVRRRMVVAVARQLIRRGFMPGRDFSSIPVGGLLLSTQAKAALHLDASPFTASLLKEIVHTFKKA